MPRQSYYLSNQFNKHSCKNARALYIKVSTHSSVNLTETPVPLPIYVIIQLSNLWQQRNAKIHADTGQQLQSSIRMNKNRSQ